MSDLAVAGDGDGGAQASVACLNGGTCTIQVSGMQSSTAVLVSKQASPHPTPTTMGVCASSLLFNTDSDVVTFPIVRCFEDSTHRCLEQKEVQKPCPTNHVCGGSAGLVEITRAAACPMRNYVIGWLRPVSCQLSRARFLADRQPSLVPLRSVKFMSIVSSIQFTIDHYVQSSIYNTRPRHLRSATEV